MSVKKQAKPLKATNVHLRSATASALRIRSVASSTAIETAQAISVIEAKLKKIGTSAYHVKLV